MVKINNDAQKVLITRQTDYAIRTVRALADGEKKTVEQICQLENIPHQFAYKILKKLMSAKIVESIRGIGGGYILKADVSDLNLYDIISLIEGRPYINLCMKEGFDCPNNKNGTPCLMHKEIHRMQSLLVEGLKENSLQSILSEKSPEILQGD